MIRHAAWLCLLLASTAGAQALQPPLVTVHGTVTTASGDHPAWFTLICTRGTGAALSMQLALGMEAAPDFPFDAYEGPRAPASFQPSARLQVATHRFAPVPVSGWRSGERDGAFVFSIATVPGKRGTATDVAAALGEPGETLTWAQSSNDAQTPPLVAQFTPDARQTLALKRAAAPCLPGHASR
ncbi:hypothetical protein [Dyella mobilis]|uniref:YcnI-like domain-containing protein n=1 Tax=Dyella mobilis TaxID=1849582 RepID=A0ABS2KLZ2_9GAMM|nr:hypothetical protein [Dyella mobilis]MBM7132165.1 hypothetical protein [Dyella mobilis]GLQ95850.1 hypothetical protein GCM10007863_02680 [Dyella mobilis]